MYDKVAEKDIANCSGKYETRNGFEGLVIYGPNGQPLRRFADHNGDRSVDQWCYYKTVSKSIATSIAILMELPTSIDGLELQGHAGRSTRMKTERWDPWKVISAEEVTMEVVEAIKARDDERFKKLLVSDAELKALGLNEEKGDQLSTRLANARKGFGDFVRTQKMITPNTKWAHFAADKPGVVPEGTKVRLKTSWHTRMRSRLWRPTPTVNNSWWVPGSNRRSMATCRFAACDYRWGGIVR